MITVSNNGIKRMKLTKKLLVYSFTCNKIHTCIIKENKFLKNKIYIHKTCHRKLIKYPKRVTSTYV